MLRNPTHSLSYVTYLPNKLKISYFLVGKKYSSSQNLHRLSLLIKYNIFSYNLLPRKSFGFWRYFWRQTSCKQKDKCLPNICYIEHLLHNACICNHHPTGCISVEKWFLSHRSCKLKEIKHFTLIFIFQDFGKLISARNIFSFFRFSFNL